MIIQEAYKGNMPSAKVSRQLVLKTLPLQAQSATGAGSGTRPLPQPIPHPAPDLAAWGLLRRRGVAQALVAGSEAAALAAGFPDLYIQAATTARDPGSPLGGWLTQARPRPGPCPRAPSSPGPHGAGWGPHSTYAVFQSCRATHRPVCVMRPRRTGPESLAGCELHVQIVPAL